MAHIERRIVDPHGVGADHDGVAVGPEPMGISLGGTSGDPPTRSVRGGGTAVDAHAQLQHHPRAPRDPMFQVGRQLSPDGGCLHTDLHLDAGITETADSCPGHPGIGILDPDDHAALRPRSGHRRREAYAQSASRAPESPKLYCRGQPIRMPPGRPPRRGGHREAGWPR